MCHVTGIAVFATSFNGRSLNQSKRWQHVLAVAVECEQHRRRSEAGKRDRSTVDVRKLIAVTTVINMLRSARRRREFVYYCGVIGLCTPCTRAPSHTGRGPCWRGGLLALAPSAARERPAQVNPLASRDPSLYGRGPLCTECRDQLPRSNKQLTPPACAAQHVYYCGNRNAAAY